MASIKVPDKVVMITQKTMYEVGKDGEFIFPIFNDGIFLLVASMMLRDEFDGVKKNPKKLLEWQKEFLKTVERLKRNDFIPVNAKKIRNEVIE